MAPPARLVLTAIVVTLGGSFHIGFVQSVINPTERVFNRFFNNSFRAHYGRHLSEMEYRLLWSSVISCDRLGAVVGAVFMPAIAERLGRKRGLYVSAALGIASCVASFLSKPADSFELFAAARFSMGVVMGIGVGLQSVYLSEISPNEHRGLIGTFSGLSCQVGVLVGAVVALPHLLGRDHIWNVIYCVQLTPILLMTVGLTFCPESPKFLMSRGNEGAALRALMKFHRAAGVSAVLAETAVETRTGRLSGRQLWRSATLRRGLLVGVLVSVGEAFSGNVAISYFLAPLLRETGMSAAAAAGGYLAACIVLILAGNACALLVDRCGRRPLLFLTMGALLPLNVGSAMVLWAHERWAFAAAGHAMLGLTFCFAVAYGMGVMPIALFITAEVVPYDGRAAAQAVTTVTRSVAFFVAATLFYPLQGAVGPYSYALFVVPPACILLYLYLRMPETKQRSIAEVMEMWNKMAEERNGSLRSLSRKIVKRLSTMRKGSRKIMKSVSMRRTIAPEARAVRKSRSTRSDPGDQPPPSVARFVLDRLARTVDVDHRAANSPPKRRKLSSAAAPSKGCHDASWNGKRAASVRFQNDDSVRNSPVLDNVVISF